MALNGIAYADDKQVVRLVATIGRHIENGGLTISVASAKQEDQ